MRTADGGADPTSVQIGITDLLFPFCGSPPSPTSVVIIAVTTGDGGALLPRSYPVGGFAFGPGGGVTIQRADLDGGPQFGPPDPLYNASSGNVTFSTIDSQRAAGMFTAQMSLVDGGSPSSLSGTFDAPTIFCP